MKTIKVSEMQNAGLGVQNIIEYAKEVRAWNEQEKMVEKTKDDPEETRYAPFPFPITHSLIADAVTQEGEPDYQLIDDTQPLPPVEPSLEEKKANAINAIRQTEQAARLALIPLGKERLLAMHTNRIQVADMAVSQKQVEAWDAEGTKYNADEMKKVIETARNTDDQTFMVEMKTIHDQIEKLSWWAAEQESIVADLTAENVDQWKMPPVDK